MEDHPPNLKTLDLRNNQLADLPVMVHRLPVETLRLAKNPLHCWDDDLLRLSTADLFKLLAQLSTLETKWNQVKVSVVGEQGVGKSALVRCLLGGHAPTSPRANSEESHSGIEQRGAPPIRICNCVHTVHTRDRDVGREGL